MRTVTAIVAVFVSLLVPRSGSAQDRHSFAEAFGGVRLSSAPTMTPTFGGEVGVALTPNIQAVGEVGRLGDVLPATADTLLAFTPVDFRVPAFYGEGGVRFTTDPHSAVGAYFETLAGVARLSAGFGGVGSPMTDMLVNTGLVVLTTTDPIAGVGGGIVFQGGSFVANAGYRFSRIFASNSFAALLTAGNLDVNEVRFGVGVRF